MKHWLVLYDIKDGKRLRKTAKVLEDYGGRVQKSVFELYASKEIINHVRLDLSSVIDCEEDFVLYFEICEKDWQKQIKIGVGKKIDAEDDDFLIL